VSNDKLPHGWTRVKFGDVVRNVSENSHDLSADGLDRVVGLDHLDPGDLRLVRWDNLADLPDGTTFTRKFKPGQVLFGKRRAYQRKVAIPDFEGVCSGDILVFEPADKRMLAEFLPYLVQSDGFFDHALGTSAGSLSPRTKWSELAKYEFAFPPIEEQRRVAEMLAAIADVGATLRLAVERLGGLLDAHAKRAIRGLEGDPVMLGNVVTLARQTIDPSKLPPDSMLEHWSIPNLDSFGHGVLERASSIGSQKKLVLGPSVLVSMLNPRIPRLVAVNGGENVVCSTEFAVYEPKSDVMLRDFLALVLRAREVWAAIERSVRGSTKSRERGSGNSVLDVRIVLPSIEVQRKMLSERRSLEQLHLTLDESLRANATLLIQLRETALGAMDVQ